MDTTAIFKAYDVRGTYPDQLDKRVAEAIGSAFATFTKSPRIVVARDMRTSGEILSAAFSRGARSVGVDVVDLGLASTDFLYFASGYLGVPGAMFTASHNPAKYNGIKMCLAGAKPVGVETGLSEIESLTNTFYEKPVTGALASYSELDLTKEWVAHVHSFADVSSFRPLKIVCDTANGMGGFVAPLVFKGLPFDVEILYPELDGDFPNHPADPLNPDNIKDLQKRVLEVGADIGLAFDGDADRVFLIDEKAQPISGSTTTATVATVMLRRFPGATILYNLICSKTVPEVIAEEGGVGVRTRVGHSYIKAVMAETGAVFGGEHSGHFYYRDNYRADSGIITAFIVLELMSKTEMPLSALVAPYLRYADSGEINSQVSNPAKTVERVAKKLEAEHINVDHLDGLTADYGSWWFNLRPSNTEPLLRLNLEAADETKCREHVDEVLALLKETK
ncbi:MAG TPA: phosphomannomutase/phosphoglucomutase [Acidimicrobiales bacterium]|nr:phosphomannomutase/phosphoglucomutase [Acidimicrobiales bacterium]